MSPDSSPRNGSWLGEERSFWQLCTAVFCAFAVLKGFAMPNNWALTQALLDYSHGFIKRALRGEVLALLHLQSLNALTAIFFAELLALLLLLAALTRSTNVQQRFGSLAPAAVFASSYALTYLANIVGYTDIPLAACAVALLLLRSPRQRFLAALAVVPMALLVHENFLLMNLPAVLFSFLVDARQAHNTERRRLLLLPAVLLAVALAITLLTSLRPNLSPAASRQFAAEMQARAQFPLHPEIFHVLSRPLAGSIRQALAGMWEWQWLAPGLESLLNLLPPVVFLLYLSRRLLRNAFPRQPERRWLWIAALLASLAPLAVYLLGFDFARWNTASAISTYLVFLVLTRATGSQPTPLTAAQRNAAVFLLAFNMATGFGFFGDAFPHAFPFFPALSPTLR